MITETSLNAYMEEQEKGSIGLMEKKVYNVLKVFKRPMTDREIAFKLGFTDLNKVRPRRNGLVDKGYVTECDKVVCRTTNKTVKTWRLK